MLDGNAQSIGSKPGAPKTGRALLAGLLRCKRCGHKLQVAYGGRHHPNIYRYGCIRAKFDHGEVAFIGFSGAGLSRSVSRTSPPRSNAYGTRPRATSASRRESREHSLRRSSRISIRPPQPSRSLSTGRVAFTRSSWSESEPTEVVERELRA